MGAMHSHEHSRITYVLSVAFEFSVNDEFKVVRQGDKKDIHGDFGDECYKGLRGSLCHGWACGPTPFISRYILGVEILEPGCRF